jgi:predicted DCC family thiol-disulfide oxidoreductase YuxK
LDVIAAPIWVPSSDIAALGSARGWLFYDGACRLCRHLAVRFGAPLRNRGFRTLELQAPGAMEALSVSRTALLDEARFLLPDGRMWGGADAIVEAARRVWWAFPVVAVAHVPGVMPLLRRLYRAVAARRVCAAP